MTLTKEHFESIAILIAENLLKYERDTPEFRAIKNMAYDLCDFCDQHNERFNASTFASYVDATYCDLIKEKGILKEN